MLEFCLSIEGSLGILNNQAAMKMCSAALNSTWKKNEQYNLG